MGFYYIPHKLILHSSSCTFHTCLMRIDQNITRISVPTSSFYHWDINYSFCQFRNIVFNLISVYPFPIGMISQALTAFDKTLLGPGGWGVPHKIISFRRKKLSSSEIQGDLFNWAPSEDVSRLLKKISTCTKIS